MRVLFSPQRHDGVPPSVSKAGDTIIINGDQIDLSVIPEGATLPAGAIGSEWIVGPVERVDGVLRVALLLPHGPNPSQAVAFPEPIILTVDGPVAVPNDRAPEEVDHGDD